MKKRWLGLAGLACVACCTLPFLPFAALGFGGLAAVSFDAWICGGLFIAMAMAGFWFVRRRPVAGSCAADGANTCSTGCGCHASAQSD